MDAMPMGASMPMGVDLRLLGCLPANNEAKRDLNSVIQHRMQASKPREKNIGERQALGAYYSLYSRRHGISEASDIIIAKYFNGAADKVTLDFLERRLSKTLSRLREKGYCTEGTLEQLVKRISVMAPEAFETLGLFPPTYTYLKCKGTSVDDQIAKNGQELWQQAIEITLMLKEPHLLCKVDSSLYVSACEKHIIDIYMMFFHRVLIASYVGNEELNNSAKQKMQEAERLLKEAELQKEEQKLCAEKAKIAFDFIKQQRERDREAAKQEVKVLERQLRELQEKNQILQMLLESSQQEDEEEQEEAQTITEEEIEEQELFSDIALPEDSTVVFLGGHPNFVKKYQKIHPNWRYISTENNGIADSIVAAGSKITCIIFYCKHISHTVFYKVTGQKDIPILYLSCQNIERGEQMIRKEYAEKVLGITARDLLEIKRKSV